MIQLKQKDCDGKMKKGIFIAIDGPDGVGKSKIISELDEELKDLGYDVFITKEVTDGPIGTLIKNNEFSGMILAELVAADRLYHIQTEILPALCNGKIVISDRYIASSYVYQQLDGVPLDFIKLVNSSVIPPDLSIFVWADLSVIMERLSARSHLTRFEYVSTPRMVDLYKEATFLFEENNYGHIYELTNNDKKDFEYNITTILKAIKSLLGR